MNNKLFLLFILITLSGFLWNMCAQNSNYVITPRATSELIARDSSIILLDVRTSEEFNGETGHLKNAILIPLQELENRIDELNKYKKNRIIVYCRTGRRSGIASELLLKNGFAAKNMEGGILRWRQENLPITKSNSNK